MCALFHTHCYYVMHLLITWIIKKQKPEHKIQNLIFWIGTGSAQIKHYSEVSINVLNQYWYFVPKVALEQFESDWKISSWHVEKIPNKDLLASRNSEMPVVSNADRKCWQWCCICLICPQWPMLWALSATTQTICVSEHVHLGHLNHNNL